MIPDLIQDLGCSLLDCSVKCCGNPEQADTAPWFSDLFLPDRQGCISAIQQCLFDLRPVSLDLPLELADRHTVHTGGTSVVDAPLDSAPHVVPLTD